MRLVCGKADVRMDYASGQVYLTLPVLPGSEKAARKIFDTGADKLTVDIEKWSGTRSPKANAYFHVLVNKLARAVGSSDEEIKRRLVCDYGQMIIDKSGAAAWFMCSIKQDPGEIHKYYRLLRKGTIDGKEYGYYAMYKQTRLMTAAEFALLIAGAIYECGCVGVDPATPDEIQNWLSLEKEIRERSEKGNGSG